MYLPCSHLLLSLVIKRQVPCNSGFNPDTKRLFSRILIFSLESPDHSAELQPIEGDTAYRHMVGGNPPPLILLEKVGLASLVNLNLRFPSTTQIAIVQSHSVL
jgi:hypothetical protein